MTMLKQFLTLLCCAFVATAGYVPKASPTSAPTDLNETFTPLEWRNIGPFRGGRSVAVSGIVGNPFTHYMGTTGGGLWKTEDMVGSETRGIRKK
jgi:hypothetical protein